MLLQVTDLRAVSESPRIASFRAVCDTRPVFLKAIHSLKREQSISQSAIHKHNPAADLPFLRVRHPNVAEYIGLCQVETLGLYLVSEYAEGRTLETLIMSDIRSGHSPSYTTLLEYTFQICLGLQALHGWSPHICHCNLTPANIIIADQVIKLTNYGIYNRPDVSIKETPEYTAKKAQSLKTTDSSAHVDSESRQVASKGTSVHAYSDLEEQHPRNINWFAPEVINEGTFSEAGDVYSFGLITLSLFSGYIPFEGLSPDQIMMQSKTPRVHTIPPNIPKHIIIVMKACLKNDPECRATIGNVYDALCAIRAPLSQANSATIRACFPRFRQIDYIDYLSKEDLISHPKAAKFVILSEQIKAQDYNGSHIILITTKKYSKFTESVSREMQIQAEGFYDAIAFRSEEKDTQAAFEIICTNITRKSDRLFDIFCRFCEECPNEFTLCVLKHFVYREFPSFLSKPTYKDIFRKLTVCLNDCPKHYMEDHYKMVQESLKNFSLDFMPKSLKKETQKVIRIFLRYWDVISGSVPDTNYLSKLGEGENVFTLTYYGIASRSVSSHAGGDKVAIFWATASDKGGIEASYLLGVHYSKLLERKDKEKAVYYLKRAAYTGHPIAQYKLAKICLKEKIESDNPAKLTSLVKFSAHTGCASAQYFYGHCYENGLHGISPDIHSAIRYYTLAAAQMHIKARLALGDIYENGKDVSIDLEKSFSWYEKAASLNSRVGQRKLAFFYKNGLFVDASMKKAFELFSSAAEKGDLIAMSELGLMYFYGNPIPVDYGIAYNLINRSASENIHLEFILGRMMWEGLGGPVNKDESMGKLSFCLLNGYNKAYEYIKPIAESNHGLAQYYVGRYLQANTQCSNFPQDHILWYYRSAQNGVERGFREIEVLSSTNAFAMRHLGYCFENGYQTRLDMRKAIRCYYDAITMNDIESSKELSRLSEKKEKLAIHYVACMYEEGLFYEMNRDKAIELFISSALMGEDLSLEFVQKYCELKDPKSLFCMGKLYESGIIHQKVFKLALEYYYCAFEMGFDEGFEKIMHHALEKQSAYAKFLLSQVYANGLGSKDINIPQAMEFLFQATMGGSEEAREKAKILLSEKNNWGLYIMSCYFLQNPPPECSVESIIDTLFYICQKDFPNAFASLKEIAQLGYGYAWYIVGLCYYQGLATDKNLFYAFQSFEKGALLGDTKSMYELAICHNNGLGTLKDDEKAIFWYMEIVSLDAQLSPFVITKLEALAEQGSAIAQYQLSIAYSMTKIEGLIEWKKVAYWASKSASQSYGPAHEFLGVIYSRGLGQGVDYDQAIHHFMTACKFGIKNGMAWLVRLCSLSPQKAQYCLGLCYLNGWSVTPNREVAMTYFSKSLQMKHKQSFDMIETLANEGIIPAIISLADAYASGHCVKQDWSTAIDWYLVAVKQSNRDALSKIIKMEERGYIKAIFLLAELYETGIMVALDLNIAIEKYHRCASMNSQEAYSKIIKYADIGVLAATYYKGVCFELGHCVNQNLADAAQCYYLAALKKYEPAVQQLEVMASYGLGQAMYLFAEILGNEAHPSPSHVQKAGEFYFKAAKSGIADSLSGLQRLASRNDPSSFRYLGLCHHEGHCVEQNTRKAVDYYSQGYVLGDKESLPLLEKLCLLDYGYALLKLSQVHEEQKGSFAQGETILEAKKRAYINGESINRSDLIRIATHDGLTLGDFSLYMNSLGVEKDKLLQIDDDAQSSTVQEENISLEPDDRYSVELFPPDSNYFLQNSPSKEKNIDISDTSAIEDTEPNRTSMNSKKEAFSIFKRALECFSMEKYSLALELIRGALQIQPLHHGCLLLKRMLYTIHPQLAHGTFELEVIQEIDKILRSNSPIDIEFDGFLKDLYCRNRLTKSVWGITCISFFGEYCLSLGKVNEAVECFAYCIEHSDIWSTFRVVSDRSRTLCSLDIGKSFLNLIEPFLLQSIPCMQFEGAVLINFSSDTKIAGNRADLLKSAANMKYVPAIYELGRLYEAKNDERLLEDAATLFSLGTLLGSSECLKSLFRMVKERGNMEALEKIRRIGASGLLFVQKAIGDYYTKDIYGATNFDEGCWWYELSGLRGYEPSLTELKSLCIKGVPEAFYATSRMACRGVFRAREALLTHSKCGRKLAFETLCQSAKRNIRSSIQDMEEIIGSNSLAAVGNLDDFANGIVGLQNLLAKCFKEGIGTKVDAKESLKWIFKSASVGHGESEYIYGEYLEKGFGCPINIEKACEMYRSALNHGVSDAINRLHALASFGTGCAWWNLGLVYAENRTFLNVEQAYVSFTIAANSGYVPALTSLGDCHLKGFGARKSIETAHEFYQKAASFGDVEAVRRLNQHYSTTKNEEGVVSPEI